MDSNEIQRIIEALKEGFAGYGIEKKFTLIDPTTMTPAEISETLRELEEENDLGEIED